MINTDGSIDPGGCPDCFARLYTRHEVTNDRCDECRERAVQEWRDFEDQHADVLGQN